MKYNIHKLKEKALCVIESCKTKEQMEVARRYMRLANSIIIRKSNKWDYKADILDAWTNKSFDMINKKYDRKYY